MKQIVILKWNKKNPSLSKWIDYIIKYRAFVIVIKMLT